MNTPLKVAAPADERTPEQAALAAPVSLPAGSYNGDALGSALDAAATGDVTARDAAVAAAVDGLNEIGTDHGTPDLQPGYKRVDVVDEAAGIAETRVVFDAPADTVPAVQAVASSTPRRTTNQAESTAPTNQADTASKGE